MTDHTQIPAATTRRSIIGRLIRVRLPWIVAATLLVTLSAALFSWLQAPLYQTAARVVVLPLVTSDSPQPRSPSMGTEKDLVSSQVVASVAAERLGVPLDQLLDAVTVSVPVDTQILEITCRGGTPEGSQRCAQELAKAYVLYKDTQPINTFPERGRLISPAPLPDAPSRPNTPLNIAAGFAIGLVLGLLVALLRDHLDDRVQSPDELEQRGLAVLAHVPAPNRSLDDPEVEPLRAPAVTEAYGALSEKVLRARALAGQGERALVPGYRGRTEVVVLTGVRPGRSAGVARELAAALAYDGERVVVVDADPHGAPAADARGGVDDEVDHRPSAHAVQATAVPGMMLLRTGPRTPGAPAVRVGSRQWADMLAGLSNSFDEVVVAAPPVLGSADGIGVIQIATSVLLTFDSRRTTRSEVDACLAELRRLRAPVTGCVLIDAHRRSARMHRGQPSNARLDDRGRGLAPGDRAATDAARNGHHPRHLATGVEQATADPVPGTFDGTRAP